MTDGPSRKKAKVEVHKEDEDVNYSVTEVTLNEETGHLMAGDEEIGYEILEGEMEEGEVIQDDHRYNVIADGESYSTRGSSEQDYNDGNLGETSDVERLFWTERNTKSLIQEYMKLLKLFRDPRCKQKDLWSKVSKNMRQNGVDVTANMCDRKWRNLKQAFKSNYYKTLKCPSTVIKWVFYDDMLKILDPKKYKPGQRKSCTIPLLSASKNNQTLPKTIVLGSKLGENHFVFPFEQNVNQQTENNVNSSSPLINNMNIVKSEKQDDSYQQVLICDDGYFVNDDSIVYQVEGSEAVNCVVDPISGQLADNNSTSQTEEIPVWFQNFIEQYRIDEDNKLAAMKKMHSELMEVEKQKCLLLEAMLKKFVS